MKGINSFSQVIVVILFQLVFYLIGQPIPVAVKLFMFALIDIMIIMIAVFEWFNSEAEWQIWTKSLYL